MTESHEVSLVITACPDAGASLSLEFGKSDINESHPIFGVSDQV